MKRSEKLLLAALAATFVIWQGYPIVSGLFFEPLKQRYAKIADLQSKITRKKVEKREIELANERLNEASSRSLPPDPVIAASLYQNWLIELAVRAKIANAAVTASNSGARPVGGTYVVVGAMIKGQATLAQLCDFLYEFRSSGLLHRVVGATVETPRHEGDPVLDITINVEGLALASSPARSASLFADTENLPKPEVGHKERQALATITSKNLFVRGYTGPPRPPGGQRPPTPTQPAQPDPSEFIYLVAAWSIDDKNEAWLFDRTKAERTILIPGGEFKVAGLEGKVLSIGKDFTTFEIKDEVWRLELGDNLAQKKKVAPPAGAARTSATISTPVSAEGEES
jgi:hypothetical protein